MNTLTLGRPDATEYPSYAAIYVNLVPGDDILRQLAAQLEEVTALLRPVDDRRAAEFSYAPGKWTPKQVLGHIIDTERIFGYRALCVARADATPLAGFEQEDYVAAGAFNQRTLSSLLEEFCAVRQSTITLLANLPQESWLRRGLANKHSVTVRGVAFLAAGHAAHHAKILREKYL